MKKKLLLIGMCLVMSSAFVACTDGAEEMEPISIEKSSTGDEEDKPIKPGGNMGGESNGNGQDPPGENEKPGGSFGS